MALLKKSDILMGIDEPRKITIESLGGEIYLRPLSSAELNEVTQIEAKGYGNFEASGAGTRDTKASGKMNLAKMQEAASKAKYEAIFISINNPKNEEWEMEELEKLKTDAIEELYNHVMVISGAETTEQDMKRFPED